jgi:uncharacterized membrane protein (DUF373 family)
MKLKDEINVSRQQWSVLTFYEKFEHVVILVLTGLIAVIIVAALWNLALKIIVAIVLSQTFDPTDPSVFQTAFGMIFTVLIALEFKRSLLVLAERRESIVQVRTVVLIALLAIVRKLMILDLATTDASHIFALAAAILALAGVYWLIRDQDRRGLG